MRFAARAQGKEIAKKFLAFQVGVAWFEGKVVFKS